MNLNLYLSLLYYYIFTWFTSQTRYALESPRYSNSLLISQAFSSSSSLFFAEAYLYFSACLFNGMLYSKSISDKYHMLACGKVLGISLFESSLRSGVGILWPYAKLFSINYLWDIDFIKVAFIADDANNSLICANNIMYFFFI